MSEENAEVQEESNPVENDNQANESLLRNRLAEQNRKHKRELEELRNQMANQNQPENLGDVAAQNVINQTQGITHQPVVPVDQIADIIRQAREEERAAQVAEQQRMQQENFNNLQQNYTGKVLSQISEGGENDPELKKVMTEYLSKNPGSQFGADATVNHLIGHDKSSAILKTMMSDSNLSKEYENADPFRQRELVNRVASQLAQEEAIKGKKYYQSPSIDADKSRSPGGSSGSFEDWMEEMKQSGRR